MTVYVEYVLIDNLIIDYLMLKATFTLTGITYARGRLFLCALFGAVVALIYPFLSHVVFFAVSVKVLSGFLIVLLAVNYPSWRNYLVNVFIFFVYTFATGGVIIGVFNLLGLEYSSEISVALSVVWVYFVLKGFGAVVKYFFKRKQIAQFTYQVEVCLCGKIATVCGFLDTGNGLYDREKPVIICSKKWFYSFVGKNLLKLPFKKIRVSTVSGQTENIAVYLDYLKIYINGEAHIFEQMPLCAVESVGSGYDLILHPELFKENCDESFSKVEKVS